MITVEDVKENREVRVFLEVSEKQLEEQGYTEHSFRHVGIVSKTAGRILEDLGYDSRTIELARLAGYLHDIGNAVNRAGHALTGALLAYGLLTGMGMDHADAAEVMLAVGNHDEGTGTAVSPISAALILADKSDVHRSRVRNTDFATFDIHDRVNYAVEKSSLHIDMPEKASVLELLIDTKICPVMDYFEIFLTRMTMNRRAADFLGLEFRLIINNNRLL